MNYISLLMGKGLTPYQGEVVFKDPDDAQKPFAPHYEKQIRPLVEGFEENRIKALKKVRLLTFLLIPVGILAGIILYFILQEGFMSEYDLYFVLAYVCILLLIVGGILEPIGAYDSKVKDKVFPKIFSFFGDFVYDQSGMSSVDRFKSSGIIPSYDQEETEDYIGGEYKGVTIRLTEAHLETEHRNHKGNVYYKTVFKGLFVILSMHKNFKGQTIIKSDKGKFGNWFEDKFNKLENVQLEDPDFEKKFEVFSDDQVEARYLLTTSFMERLLKLTALFGEKEIQASFYDDKFLIMIPSCKNRFEAGSIFSPATFEEEINTILAEMNEIFQIVDTLKLNQNIGL